MDAAYSEALNGGLAQIELGHEFVPLNRMEASNWDLLSSFSALAHSDALTSLRDELRDLTGRAHIFIAPSCRAAIAQVLSLLPQREVVMPVYTCGVVKLAAEIAGKRVIFADVSPNSVNSTSTEFEKHAQRGRIIVPTHLFGIPTDIDRICELARQRGCVTIEDAAAAVGARFGNGMLGTFGDVGVFSFERSKRFPAFRGAAIVVNNEHVLDPERLAVADASGMIDALPLREILSAVSHNVATTPWVYSRFVVPRQLRRYAARAEPDVSEDLTKAVAAKPFTHRFHPYQAALVRRMLGRIETIRERISTLVSVYLDELRASSTVTFLPETYDHGGLLRFPIAIPGVKRADIIRHALRRGLFLETNYEQLLSDDVCGNFPNARLVADSVLLLPLYAALSKNQAQQIAREIVRIGRAEGKQ
jgi:perosamine synthetase